MTVIIAILTLTIFALDALTPLGYAEWIFYLFPLFLASRALSKQYFFSLVTAIVMFIVLGFFISPEGGSLQRAFINRTVETIALLVVALLLAKRRDDEVRLEKLNREIERSEQQFRLVAEAAGTMVYDLDCEGGSLLIVRGLKELLGYSPAEISFTRDWWEGQVHPDDILEANKLLQNAIESETDYSFEYRIRHKQGEYIIVHDTGKIIRDSEGRALRIIGGVVDVTDRRRMEDEIRHMAHHDALTGLPNRRLFLDITRVELAQARRYKKKAAILFLDLDRFKEVNDSLGHEAGDELLKEVAHRLKTNIRESDTVARIGGDEFNILLTNISTIDDIAVIVNKITTAFQRTYSIAGHEMHMTTSVGISIFPDDSDDIEILLKYADHAMYEAKEHGRNTYRFYSSVRRVTA